MESDKNTSLNNWRDQEIIALDLLKIAGELRYNYAIDLLIFRREIFDSQPSRIIRLHREATNYSDKVLTIETTVKLARSILDFDNIAPSRIDLGSLGIEWLVRRDTSQNMSDFVQENLSHVIGAEPKNEQGRDVVLYGFGRIGRLAARRIIELTGKGEQLCLRAIVIRPKLSDHYEEAQKRAALLSSDSVHGKFNGTIDVSPDGTLLTINGNPVHLIFANHPSEIDYTTYGINNAIVLDNTGVWRDRPGLSKHIRPGIDKVMLTAPAKGDIPNIVHGVNELQVDFDQEKIISAASCTTNAIAPALKVIHDKFGIEKGHIETVHSYTNDQNLLDNFHKKPRRGRGAPINMVMTSTGAASAVGKVIPELLGKLSGNAIRVPTPNVSLAILNLTLSKSTDLSSLLELIKSAAFHGALVEQIMYSTSSEFVSSDAVGVSSPSIFDAPSTIVSEDGKSIVIYLWYDNEYGYTCQVIRLAKHVTKVKRHVYY